MLNYQNIRADKFKFTHSFFRGMTNSDVTELQKIFSQIPGIYPEAIISGYFGQLTERAVQRYQLQYQIVTETTDHGYGYVGPKTRGRLNVGE